MKFNIIILVALLFAFKPVIAQENVKKVYPLVMSFQSECCGVPSDSVLRSFIHSFKKQYKVKKIIAYRIGPMGREGEYYLAFPFKELNKKQKSYFVKRIKGIKKYPSDPGLWSFQENKQIDAELLPKRATTTKIVF